ncbi:dienelactone hydrolase family-domain-containing protein [Dipodascopsis tothii]|uniref:dienelactone hydrolase family-domain-containing protein n=1 Tax=Dipodascopsis tothii TaxID=44089 RepID=UPI0034CF9496
MAAMPEQDGNAARAMAGMLGAMGQHGAIAGQPPGSRTVGGRAVGSPASETHHLSPPAPRSSPTMASNAPGLCCLSGTLHEGTPAGEHFTYKDIEFYLAKPAVESKKAIIYLSDIFGFPVVNHKLLSDEFAKFGFVTVYPNLFFDDPAPFPRTAGFDLGKWLEIHNFDVTDKIAQLAIDYVHETFPEVTDIFAVGYCYGARNVVHLLMESKLAAGYVAHPSLITEDELRAIKGPLSIAAAETDEIFPEEKRHVSEAILKEIGATYSLTLYSSVEHGFAVRSDLAVPNNKWAKEAAFIQAVTWFERFVSE